MKKRVFVKKSIHFGNMATDRSFFIDHSIYFSDGFFWRIEIRKYRNVREMAIFLSRPTLKKKACVTIPFGLPNHKDDLVYCLRINFPENKCHWAEMNLCTTDPLSII
jgi:hypothetical protein